MFALLAAACLVLAACGKASSPAPAAPTSTTGPAAQPTPPPLATAQATAVPQVTLDSFGLVYVDRRAGPAQLVLARADGTSPKTLGTLASGTRALDIAGPNLLLAASDSLTVMNLASGGSVKVPITGNVTFARLVGDASILYAVVSGCGPPGPPKTSLMLADLKTQQSKEVTSFASGALTIMDVDLASGTAAVAPRDCDVTTSEVDLVKLADGTKQTFAVQGCGFVDVAIAQKLGIVSWLACTRPDAHKNDDASLYQLNAPSPAARAVTAPGGGSNKQSWLLRPGQAQAALGTAMPVNGPGGAVSGGLWLFDMITAAFDRLAPAAGSEQYPVAWSPDGRYLLAASVQAQGLCAYSYVDMTTKAVKALDDSVTQCGANGDVLGWAVVR
jgi:hypothetical protein